MQQSLETRWKKADQDIFIAAVILNPLYRLKAFAPLPALTRAGVTILIERLWQRFYPGQTANDLLQELRDYLDDKGRYSGLTLYVNTACEEAERKVHQL